MQLTNEKPYIILAFVENSLLYSWSCGGVVKYGVLDIYVHHHIINTCCVIINLVFMPEAQNDS